MPRNKVQNVGFDTLQELLDFLPADERAITEELRTLVYNCVPKVKEKLSFNVPFFHYKSTLCFIWPGSVDWMGKTYPGKVQFGFYKGYLLNDRYGYLEKGTRKQMHHRMITSMEDIKHEIIAELLYEAADLNEELARK
jgi:hypothetical protein